MEPIGKFLGKSFLVSTAGVGVAGAAIAIGAGPIGACILGSSAVVLSSRVCDCSIGSAALGLLTTLGGVKYQSAIAEGLKPIAAYVVDIPFVQSVLSNESLGALMENPEAVRSYISSGYANLCSFEPVMVLYNMLPTEEAVDACIASALDSLKFLVSYRFETATAGGIIIGVSILLCLGIRMVRKPGDKLEFKGPEQLKMVVAVAREAAILGLCIGSGLTAIGGLLAVLSTLASLANAS